jgi:hypothetical protein
MRNESYSRTETNSLTFKFEFAGKTISPGVEYSKTVTESYSLVTTESISLECTNPTGAGLYQFIFIGKEIKSGEEKTISTSSTLCVSDNLTPNCPPLMCVDPNC